MNFIIVPFSNVAELHLTHRDFRAQFRTQNARQKHGRPTRAQMLLYSFYATVLRVMRINRSAETAFDVTALPRNDCAANRAPIHLSYTVST